MPEMRFLIRWPDGAREECYSPSLVVKDFLAPGTSYPVPDFVARATDALTIASNRVRAKYGFPCGLAAGQLARITTAAAPFLDRPDAFVAVESFIE